MLRIILSMCLACSLTLNVFLLLDKNAGEIERKITSKSQALNLPTEQKAIRNKASANFDYVNNTEASSRQALNNETVKKVNKIKESIDNNDFIIASLLCEQLLFNAEKGHMNDVANHWPLSEVKEYWLNATNKLIHQSQFSDAQSSIDSYLDFQADDTDFLYLQVALYQQKQLPLFAIKSAYDVQFHVFDEAQKRQALQYARNLVQAEADNLIKHNQWYELVEFIDQVILLDPDYINLQWLLALAHFQLGENELARSILPLLLEHPNFKVKAEALLAEIDASLVEPDSIALSRQGEHFIVDASINNRVDVSLLLDTGASISLLSLSAFEVLTQYSEATYLRDVVMNTAGGDITASLYQVSEIAVDDYVVKDFVFAVSNFVSEKNDGLLGMNFLKEFDFHLDQKNSTLSLKRK